MGRQNEQIFTPPIRILKVYIEALTGFSHIFSPVGLSNTSLSPSRPCPWNWLPLWERGPNVHSMDREEDEDIPVAQVHLVGQPITMSS